MENAGNGISKPLDFKIFWGSMPPDPSIDFKSYHLKQNVVVMFKFVNVNKLVLKETLKSGDIQSDCFQ